MSAAKFGTAKNAKCTTRKTTVVIDSIREIALAGATAGLPPTVLIEHGATAIGTVRVTNGDRAMRVIAEDDGTPSLRDAIEFVVHRPVPRARERR